jgi:hypothetical protein
MNLPWQMKRNQDEALPDPLINGGGGPCINKTYKLSST